VTEPMDGTARSFPREAMAADPTPGPGEAAPPSGQPSSPLTRRLTEEVARPRPPSLLDRLWTARDRLLASPGFQRWAAAFPLTRPIALRRSRQLFDLVGGFVYTQTVLAGVRLGLFQLLSEGPLPPERVSRELKLGDDTTLRLLGAGVSLRLLRRTRDGRFGLGPLGAPLVDNPALAAMLEHNTLFYRDLEDPVALLRSGRGRYLSRYWPYARSADPSGLDPAEVAEYSALMAASQPLVAREVLDQYPFRRHRRVLDVGGGEGAFLEQVAHRVSGLELTLFDLPAVAARARARLREKGLGGRVEVVGGDFLRDPLPRGADLVTLVRILHDQDDHQALTLLSSARRVLGPEGVLLVAEPMAGIRGAEPLGAYFALYLMAMGQGRLRTPGEIVELLHRAGFRKVRVPRARAPVLTGIATASP